MKNRVILYVAAAFVSLTGLMSSCSEDSLDSTIFEIPNPSLDRTASTFPLDTFLKAEYLDEYNLKYLYRMEDVGADMQKNLVPVSYDKSIDFAVLCKYLWLDVYREKVGREFLREHCPRIIHLLGSAAYNATSGTKTIGLAEGGIKITLMQGNMIDEANLDFMNEQFFKTMHHEFGHILHQHHLYPTSFRLISNGLYNPMDWNSVPDSVAASRGFISPYSQNGVSDDWVEIFANYIVKDSTIWNNTLNSAEWDWEVAENVSRDTLEQVIKNLDDPATREYKIPADLIGYIHEVASWTNVNGTRIPGQYNLKRKKISRDDNGHPILQDGTIIEIGNGAGTSYAGDGKGWTTRVMATGEPMDPKEVVKNLAITKNADAIDGKAIILQKLDMVRTWAKDYFDMDIDAIRAEVQRRQYLIDDNGYYIKDANGNYINALISPSKSDPSKSQMDVIRQWVTRFKELQK